MAVALEARPTGEVRVETGTGVIKKLDHDPDKRNAQVSIKATHTDLREDVKAWVDTQGPLWQFAGDAYGHGIEVRYRIEVHRHRDVAPDKPIAELTNRQKVRDLIELAPANAVAPGGPIGKMAHEAAQDRPQAAANGSSGQQEPDGDEGATSVLQAGLEATEQRSADRARAAERQAAAAGAAAAGAGDAPAGIRCDLCDVAASSSAELLEHAKGAQHRANEERARQARQADASRAAATFDGDARDRPIPPAPDGGRRRAKIEEGKPWDLLNSDGSLNLASYSYQAVLGFVELAHDLASQRVRDVLGEGGSAAELKIGQVEALARMLLEAADRCQAMTRQDGRVDRMDASHTRARGAIRTALKVYPVPWGADADTRAAWLDDLSNHAAALTRIALDLFRFHETGESR